MAQNMKPNAEKVQDTETSPSFWGSVRRKLALAEEAATNVVGDILGTPGYIVDLGNLGLRAASRDKYGYEGSLGEKISKRYNDVANAVDTKVGLGPVQNKTSNEELAVTTMTIGGDVAAFFLPGGILSKGLKFLGRAETAAKVGVIGVNEESKMGKLAKYLGSTAKWVMGAGVATAGAGVAATAIAPGNGGPIQKLSELFHRAENDWGLGATTSAKEAKEDFEKSDFMQSVNNEADPLVKLGGMYAIATSNSPKEMGMRVAMFTNFIRILEQFALQMFPALKAYIPAPNAGPQRHADAGAPSSTRLASIEAPSEPFASAPDARRGFGAVSGQAPANVAPSKEASLVIPSPATVLSSLWDTATGKSQPTLKPEPSFIPKAPQSELALG